MKFSTLLFAASAALLPTSFAIEGSAKKYLRSGAISAINPSDRNLGSTDDWCPGFTDQFCIKTNQPADGGSVEVHADFNISPNADGSYDWSVGFTESPQDIIDRLDTGSDPIMLKYAIIDASFTFPDDPQYIKFGGSCHNTQEDNSCMIVKHEYPAGGDPANSSWTSEDLIASGTIPAGSTLIWWLHINLKYDGSIGTSFALPCANADGTFVDPNLEDIYNTSPNTRDFLSAPFPQDLTFVDPDDGTYVFDHISQVHGWGWQFYYTAPSAPCDDIPPPTPDCQDPPCGPVCIDPPLFDVTGDFCTTEITILAGQHIPVGTATLKMDDNGSGFDYTITAEINYVFDGFDNKGEYKHCTIRPKVPADDKCENVKVQSGELKKPKDIGKLPLGKYADKCCLPQDESSTGHEILIAEGNVEYCDCFPLSIHFDLQVYCDEEEVPFSWTDASCETGFAMELIPGGNCPFNGFVGAKHGWGMALDINTEDPTNPGCPA